MTNIPISWKRAGVAFLAFSAPFFLSNVAVADDSDFNRFELRLGTFITDRDTDLGLDTEAGEGTKFDLESDFGADPTKTVFRADAVYRFTRKHRIDAGYFSLSRSATRAIDREITVGGQVFDIDANIESRLQTKIFKLAYSYMFAEGDNYEFGPTIGLFLQKNSARFEETNLGALVADSLSIPLPVFGVRGRYDLSNRLHFLGSGEFFFISYDKYKGKLADVRVAMEYDLFQNVGVGIGLNWIKIDVDIDNPVIDWSIDWRTSGLLAYAKFAF